MNNQPLGYCPRCGTPHYLGTNFCSNCALPLRNEPPPRFYSPPVENPAHTHGFTLGRKVGGLLGLGIFVMPYIFSWFTLRAGYSKTARIVSFAWLGWVVLVWGAIVPTSITKDATTTAFTPAKSTYTSSPSESPKSAALRQVKIDFSWGTGGFGSVMEANFKITNPSEYAIKDLEVTCTHFASSGTKIDSNTRTIYEIVPARGTKKVNDFNMGFIHSQAKQSSCEVTDLLVVQ